MDKSTGVRATTTTKLGINLKPIPCIGKGPECVHNVRALRIRPQGNPVVHQSYYGQKIRGCGRNLRKTSVNTLLYVSTSSSLQGSDGTSGSASQCLSVIEVPEAKESTKFSGGRQ